MSRRRRSVLRKRLSRRVTLEHLEPRALLAVLSVGPSDAYATIQEAVDNARSEDVILIAEGIYPESVDLGRMGIAVGGAPGGLIVRGDSVGETVIESPGGSVLFNSAAFAGDLSLEGLTVRASAGATVDKGLVLQDYAGNLHVTDVEFSDLEAYGIELTGVSGEFSMVDSVFRDLGSSVDAMAIRIADFDGMASITGNLIEDVAGTAIRLENSGSQVASVMINDNTVRGEGTFFSTTQSGIVVSLSGASQTDLTLDNNTLESLAVSAIDVEVSGAAELHTRWSRNVASNIDGPVVLRFDLRDNAQVDVGLWQNTVIDATGDGLVISLQGNSAFEGVIRENQFTSIGDAAGDDALTIQSGSDSSARLNVSLHKNDFLTVAGMGLHLSADGASVFQASIMENFFTEVNTQDGGSAFLAEQATANASADLLLRLADNDVILSAGTAYSLRYRGSGDFDLEGTAANAASQIALVNTGQPIVVSGSVDVVSPGSLAGSVPLLLGDRVWHDLDGNGLRDEGEPGVADVQLTLTGTETVGGAAVSRATLTDSKGVYAFVGLMAGDYTVVLELPTAMAMVDSDRGVDDSIDSDFVRVNTRSAQASVSLVAAVDDVTLDAGLATTWQNPNEPNATLRYDVNGDGYVTALDVLTLITEIDSNGSRALPIPPLPPETPPPYLDVDGNGELAPVDILRVVNFLNRSSGGGGEGEAVARRRDASKSLAAVLMVHARRVPLARQTAWDAMLPETLGEAFLTSPF